MASITYTRAELLSLYQADLPLPQGTNKIVPIVQDNQTLPLLLTKQKTKEYHNRGGAMKIKPDIERPQKQNSQSDEKVPIVLQQQPVTTPLAWYYLDKSNTMQGPFPSTKLREWWEARKFPADLQITLVKDPSTVKHISYYFPNTALAFSYNPIIFPFMGPIKPNQEDPLESIFLSFQTDVLTPKQ